jgi:hypothetical protein
MAENQPYDDGHRQGTVTDRSQTYNPKTGNWTKRNTKDGRFKDQKAERAPLKGVRKEK